MLGEARYWLGEFDAAEATLHGRSRWGAADDRVCAHASRFLADITVTLRGDVDLARALFERSLEAARRLEGAFVLARTLVMAAWVPFFRGVLDEAEALFREALTALRAAASAATPGPRAARSRGSPR